MTSDTAAKRPDLTLHQLRIFWAVANARTLTNAAKQLGMAQPSLSQQLARMEQAAGTPLFHRRSSAMELTEAGAYLLPRAEQVLRAMQMLDDGLVQFRLGQRVTIHIAGITSILRVLLPPALAQLQRDFPEIELDIHERAPADILELLYSRRVHVGLLAGNSVAEAGVDFAQIPLAADPYVLAVPDWLDLDEVTDLAALPPDHAGILGRSIRFAFGTQHTKRIEAWFERVLPDNQIAAQCRSFEVAIELVRGGTGVCLVPALATVHGATTLDGVRLYRVDAAPRRLVALIPSQYQRVEPYASLIGALARAGDSTRLPPMRATPPLLNHAPVAGF